MHQLYMIDSSRYIRPSMSCFSDVTITCSGYPHPCSGAFSAKEVPYVTFAKSNFYSENFK